MTRVAEVAAGGQRLPRSGGPSFAGVLFVALGAAAALTGCSPSQYFAQPARVEQIDLTTRDLKTQQAEQARRVESIETTLAAQNKLLSKMNADLNVQLDALIQKLREMSSRLDDLTSNSQRQARVNSSFQPRPTPGSDIGPVAGGDSTSGDRLDPQQLYDAAYQDISRGSYRLAVSGFQEFLRLYPDHQLADNSQYWLGECAYVQDDLPRAVDEFQKVVRAYPDGDKVPAALLKLGFSALRLNDSGSARRWFDDLIKRFPNTEEARTARSKLATIN